MTIREQVSKIVGFHISKGRWDESFKELSQQGVISQKQLIEMVLVLLKREESREDEKI